MTDPLETPERYDPVRDFTKSPYERMIIMSRDNYFGDANPEPPYPDDPDDPCFGCGNWRGPCLWPCYRQMGYDKYIQ